MTLRELQSVFAQLSAQLIQQAEKFGYDVTLGEAWRSPETAKVYAEEGKGIVDSLHIERLAIDLNLFKQGAYLTDTKDYEILGEWWEGLSCDNYKCAWGGRFHDGNHFSIEYEGKK
jgi:hypothetical protein